MIQTSNINFESIQTYEGILSGVNRQYMVWNSFYAQ